MITLTHQLVAGVFDILDRPHSTDGGDRQGGELIRDAALPAALVQEVLSVGWALKDGDRHGVADVVAVDGGGGGPHRHPQVSVALSDEKYPFRSPW